MRRAAALCAKVEFPVTLNWLVPLPSCVRSRGQSSRPSTGHDRRRCWAFQRSITLSGENLSTGFGYITRHRDPPTAGGIIAITTLAGHARFRVWDDDGVSDVPSSRHDRAVAHERDTDGGDLGILRGDGWPGQASRCPVHEVESPSVGDRIILTLRYNKGGFGANYFSCSG
jgi:hypothetical protein